MEKDEEKSYDTSYNNGSRIIDVLIYEKEKKVKDMDIEELNTINNMSVELGNALAQSSMYKRYIAARDVLVKDGELFNRVMEYRKNSFFIHNCSDNDRVDKLRGMYGDNYDMIKDKKVREYLDAELVLCRAIQNLNNNIVEKLELDLDFLK